MQDVIVDTPTQFLGKLFFPDRFNPMKQDQHLQQAL